MPEKPSTSDGAEPQTRSGRPRLRWPRRWRTSVLVFVMATWVILLGIWLTSSQSAPWRNWLSNLKAPESDSHRSSRYGVRRSEGGTTLTYLGDGKAALGKYSVKTFDPLSRTTLRTDFRLEGRTACEDEDAFAEFMKSNHRFFREQVTATVRNCDPDDMTNPNLQLFERKLVSTVNRALGRRFLKSVDVKDFQLLEQVGDSGFVRYEIPDDAKLH